MEKEVFNKILEAAMRAPSGDNMQPWKIKNISRDYSKFDIYIEIEEESFFDCLYSASQISCGCFLENLIQAANYFNYDVKFKIDEDSNSFKIATLSLSERKKNSIDLNYYDFIFKRYICRKDFLKKEFDEHLNIEIKSELKKYSSCKLRLISDTKNISNILFDADVVRWNVKSAHRVMFSNLRYSNSDVEKTKNGLDSRLLGIPFLPSLTMRILGMWPLQQFFEFTKINRIESYISTKKLLAKPTQIAIVTIDNYSKKNLIEAGMLYEKLQLIITKYMGSTQPFASLPFFVRNIERGNPNFFSEKQIDKIKKLKNRLYLENNISNSEELVMIFRYGVSTEAKVKTLRYDLNKVISNY